MLTEVLFVQLGYAAFGDNRGNAVKVEEGAEGAFAVFAAIGKQVHFLRVFGHEAGQARALFVGGGQPRFDVDTVGADEGFGEVTLAQVVGGDCAFKGHHVFAQFAAKRVHVGVFVRGEDGQGIEAVDHDVDGGIRQGAHEFEGGGAGVNDEGVVNGVNEVHRRPAPDEAFGVDVLRFAHTALERRDEAVGGYGTTVLPLGDALFLQVVEVAVDGHQRDFEALGEFL